jgi:hypothetical protein
MLIIFTLVCNLIFHNNDLKRFPPMEVIEANIDFIRDHDVKIKAIKEYGDNGIRQKLERYIYESEYDSECWYLLLQAHQYSYDRFFYLVELRRKIGIQNYLLGRMPPHVPVHLFN